MESSIIHDHSYLPHQTFESSNFLQAWEEHYHDLLLIRPPTQHSTCGVCARHKLILKRLAKDPEARRDQMLRYKQHLSRQYRHRACYWQARGMSRLGPAAGEKRTLCIMLDSIDHSKFAVPRARCLGSKDFANFIRPTMHCTAALVHGVATFVILGEPFTMQNSSWTVDILAHIMHVLALRSDIDLRNTELVLVTDNASKEGKNNTVLRFLSGMVLTRKLLRAEFRSLESGHSREDLDQAFSSLASHIHSDPDLFNPEQFLSCIRRWLNTPNVRPLEPVHVVEKLDMVRSWLLATAHHFFCWSRFSELSCELLFFANLFNHYQSTCSLEEPNCMFAGPKSLSLTCLRKEHLTELCQQNMIRGIGGPGAPHVIAFDRFDSLGATFLPFLQRSC